MVELRRPEFLAVRVKEGQVVARGVVSRAQMAPLVSRAAAGQQAPAEPALERLRVVTPGVARPEAVGRPGAVMPAAARQVPLAAQEREVRPGVQRASWHSLHWSGLLTTQ